MKVVHTIAIVFLFLATITVKAQQSADKQTILKTLSKQVAAWNRGDLEAFMEGYWQNDSLLFVGKNGPKYGYNTTLNNYRKEYPDTASMGKLAFDILQVKPLSPQYYFVLGKWHLQRSIGDIQGHFTLLFRKIKGRWLIVADHSS